MKKDPSGYWSSLGIKGGEGSGENEGHPFRGNQWTEGQGGGSESEKPKRDPSVSSLEGREHESVGASTRHEFAKDLAGIFDGKIAFKDKNLTSFTIHTDDAVSTTQSYFERKGWKGERTRGASKYTKGNWEASVARESSMGKHYCSIDLYYKGNV
jgi:hypothetical protein